jgi:hypothetical protein
MLSAISRRLSRNRFRTSPIERVSYFTEADELPECPRIDELAVAGTRAHPKWALLDCPCGKGHTILLGLDSQRTPRWTLSINKSRRPTLYPSVDRISDGRRCHFWLRNGEIEWVGKPFHRQTKRPTKE